VRNANIAVAAKIIRMAVKITPPNMTELESLTSRAAELSSKVDFWNNAVLVVLLIIAVAGAAIFVAQRKAFFRAKDLSVVEDRIATIKEGAAKTEQERIGRELAAAEARAKEADARIAEAQRGSAEANERATKAQESLSLAEQHSAEANAKAEGFRLDIAKANEGAARAQAQVAGATAEAAKANLELARLKTPRTLSAEQLNRLTLRMRRFTGQKFSFNVYPDAESMALAAMVDSALKSAGWERIPSQSGDVVVTVAGETAGTAYLNGIQAFVGPEDNGSVPALVELASAMSDSGIPCTPHKTDQLRGKTPMAILVAIGNKPQ